MLASARRDGGFGGLGRLLHLGMGRHDLARRLGSHLAHDIADDGLFEGLAGAERSGDCEPTFLGNESAGGGVGGLAGGVGLLLCGDRGDLLVARLFAEAGLRLPTDHRCALHGRQPTGRRAARRQFGTTGALGRGGASGAGCRAGGRGRRLGLRGRLCLLGGARSCRRTIGAASSVLELAQLGAGLIVQLEDRLEAHVCHGSEPSHAFLIASATASS